MGRSSAKVTIRHSKTDQMGKGRSCMLGKCSEAELYPVTTLLAYIEKRGAEDGYLFQNISKEPLIKHQFWAVTSRALS